MVIATLLFGRMKNLSKKLCISTRYNIFLIINKIILVGGSTDRKNTKLIHEKRRVQ